MNLPSSPIFWHVGAWAFYLLTLVLGAVALDQNFRVAFFANNVPVILLFYLLVFFLFPRFLGEKRYLSLLLWLLAVNVGAVGFRFLVAIFLIGQPSLPDLLDAQLRPMFWRQLRLNLLFTGIGFAYWFARRNYLIEMSQRVLEKEVLDARLRLLKNQINPHFLYNTLSFIYTRALPLSEELAAAIARLSEMMRYSLGEAGEDGEVALESEVAHLRNFIDIHQMRFDNRLAVRFEVEGDPANQSVMPLLLVTFVENAFKHGSTHDPRHPLVINLRVEGKDLRFFVKNRESKGTKGRSSGIGLQNVRNRLALAYPGRHELNIEDGADFFTVGLQLTTRP